MYNVHVTRCGKKKEKQKYIVQKKKSVKRSDRVQHQMISYHQMLGYVRISYRFSVCGELLATPPGPENTMLTRPLVETKRQSNFIFKDKKYTCMPSFNAHHIHFPMLSTVSTLAEKLVACPLQYKASC